MKKYSVMIFILVLLHSYLLTGQEISEPNDQAIFGLAQSLNNMQHFSKAAEKLEGLYNRYPVNKKVAFEYAKALGYGKQIDKAVEILNSLENQYPDDKQIKQLYASILEANQRFDEALNRYILLLENNPEDKKLKEKIGDLAAWMYQYPTSIKYYSQLAAEYPEDIAIKRKLADTCMWAKDYSCAIIYYQQVLKANPNDKTVLINLADIYYWSKDEAQAAETYSKLNLDPVTDKQRYTNFGFALMTIGQHQKAEQVFKKLVETYPNDIELRIALANNYYAIGNIAKAEKEFEILMGMMPDNTEVAVKLAQLTAAGGNRDAAINLCRKILAKHPQNRQIKILLARLLSWEGRFEESITIYNELIQEEKSSQLQKEKARVLGWIREYEKSIKEYKAVLAENPDELAKTEMKAKESFYNLHDLNGEKYHLNWLKLEPNSLEAYYDLGQIYARNNQWDKSADAYKKVLSLDSASTMAQKAINKIDLYRYKKQFKAGFEFVEADSSSRDIDQRYWNIFSSLRFPMNSKTYLTVRENSMLLDYDSIENVYRQGTGLNLEYFADLNLKASANYTYNVDSDDFGHSNIFGGKVDYLMNDQWEFNISHQREDIIDNGITFEDRLYRDNYKVRTVYKPSRRLNAGADYTYSPYSDDNNRDAYGFDLEYYLNYEPRSLKVVYRFEEYHFNRSDTDYFSPASFHYNRVGLEFRHFLNKDFFLWPANQTYYTLGYAINFDVHQQNGHIIYADLHHDWNETCSSGFEFSKMIYEQSEIYGLNRILFYTVWYF